MTLVEQLVTLVLISVGLLGIAALQASGLKESKDAYTRLRASMLATEILDRMRANPSGFRNDEYSVAFNGMGTPDTTAGVDLFTWQAEIDRLLPGGSAHAAGAIRRTPGTNFVTVIVRWKNSTNSASHRGTELPTVTTRTEL